MFDNDAVSKVQDLANLEGAEGLVVFENRVIHSPEYKKKTVVAIGETLTHKSVIELKGSWIYDDDQRQDAVAFCVFNKAVDQEQVTNQDI